MEKPAALVEDDAPSLAAALMAQRPPARPRKDALLEAERLHHRCVIEVLREDFVAEAARCGTLLGMLEHLCERRVRDLAELQMARERALCLRGRPSARLAAVRRWSAASRSSRKRTEIFAGERTNELEKKPKSSNGPKRLIKKNRRSCSR